MNDEDLDRAKGCLVYGPLFGIVTWGLIGLVVYILI